MNINIKIQVERKEDFATFYNSVTVMFAQTRNEMEFDTYYNSVCFTKILHAKIIEINFSPNKKFSVKLTPNHFTAFDFMWSKKCKYFQAENILIYNLMVQLFEQAQRGYEAAKHLNLLARKGIDVEQL